ncbi:mavicyanin [Brachypodium distachyon]|uniref:Phytocyanin domain-containing protein n=1 Tax=Brachypodium distachyon TaxID=15368 RepID=I1HRX1_BRADI|nr:mavicyanin [Brachypodium distachyon]KQK09889.1 hypothetical protein BRADI_2g50790v3 [Brachypodium distachyon]|eukprot:XP_003567142.1 mavicyanin [Brachypodium distachyon]
MAAASNYLLLVTLVLFAAASLPPSSAEDFTVGDKQQWAANVNYTSWPDKYRFHVGDWLVFKYQKGMFDVMQVDEAAYEKCDASKPIASYDRGTSFPFQLNHTGRYYFICSKGYCWGGMKVSVLVEPPASEQPPAVAPSTSRAAARHGAASWAALAAALALVGSAVLGLPFAA